MYFSVLKDPEVYGKKRENEGKNCISKEMLKIANETILVFKMTRHTHL